MNFLKKNLIFLLVCPLLFAGCKQIAAIIDYIQTATTILVICICFAGIIFVMWTSIFKIKNQPAAVVVSSVLCCVIMIPLTVSLNYFIQKSVAKTILDEENAQLAIIRAEAKAKTLEKQKLENEVLIVLPTLNLPF